MGLTGTGILEALLEILIDKDSTKTIHEDIAIPCLEDINYPGIAFLNREIHLQHKIDINDLKNGSFASFNDKDGNNLSDVYTELLLEGKKLKLIDSQAKGKTTLIKTIIYNLHTKGKNNVYYISRLNQQLIKSISTDFYKIINSIIGINNQKLDFGSKLQLLNQNKDMIKFYPIIIFDDWHLFSQKIELNQLASFFGQLMMIPFGMVFIGKDVIIGSNLLIHPNLVDVILPDYDNLASSIVKLYYQHNDDDNSKNIEEEIIKSSGQDLHELIYSLDIWKSLNYERLPEIYDYFTYFMNEIKEVFGMELYLTKKSLILEALLIISLKNIYDYYFEQEEFSLYYEPNEIKDVIQLLVKMINKGKIEIMDETGKFSYFLIHQSIALRIAKLAVYYFKEIEPQNLHLLEILTKGITDIINNNINFNLVRMEINLNNSYLCVLIYLYNLLHTVFTSIEIMEDFDKNALVDLVSINFFLELKEIYDIQLLVDNSFVKEYIGFTSEKFKEIVYLYNIPYILCKCLGISKNILYEDVDEYYYRFAGIVFPLASISGSTSLNLLPLNINDLTIETLKNSDISNYQFDVLSFYLFGLSRKHFSKWDLNTYFKTSQLALATSNTPLVPVSISNIDLVISATIIFRKEFTNIAFIKKLLRRAITLDPKNKKIKEVFAFSLYLNGLQLLEKEKFIEAHQEMIKSFYMSEGKQFTNVASELANINLKLAEMNFSQNKYRIANYYAIEALVLGNNVDQEFLSNINFELAIYYRNKKLYKEALQSIKRSLHYYVKPKRIKLYSDINGEIAEKYYIENQKQLSKFYYYEAFRTSHQHLYLAKIVKLSKEGIFVDKKHNMLISIIDNESNIQFNLPEPHEYKLNELKNLVYEFNELIGDPSIWIKISNYYYRQSEKFIHNNQYNDIRNCYQLLKYASFFNPYNKEILSRLVQCAMRYANLLKKNKLIPAINILSSSFNKYYTKEGRLLLSQLYFQLGLKSRSIADQHKNFNNAFTYDKKNYSIFKNIMISKIFLIGHLMVNSEYKEAFKHLKIIFNNHYFENQEIEELYVEVFRILILIYFKSMDIKEILSIIELSKQLDYTFKKLIFRLIMVVAEIYSVTGRIIQSNILIQSLVRYDLDENIRLLYTRCTPVLLIDGTYQKYVRKNINKGMIALFIKDIHPVTRYIMTKSSTIIDKEILVVIQIYSSYNYNKIKSKIENNTLDSIKLPKEAISSIFSVYRHIEKKKIAIPADSKLVFISYNQIKSNTNVILEMIVELVQKKDKLDINRIKEPIRQSMLERQYITILELLMIVLSSKTDNEAKSILSDLYFGYDEIMNVDQEFMQIANKLNESYKAGTLKFHEMMKNPQVLEQIIEDRTHYEFNKRIIDLIRVNPDGKIKLPKEQKEKIIDLISGIDELQEQAETDIEDRMDFLDEFNKKELETEEEEEEEE